MKLLFISAKDVNKKSNGGEICTNRNYLAFCELLGKENVTVINLFLDLETGFRNAILKRINFLNGFYEGLNPKKIKHIINLSDLHNFVFIDSSIHGTLALILKKYDYKGKIISFFHNVEYKIKKQRITQPPWKFAELFVTRYSEKMACKYSDKIVVLNNRDKADLNKIYNTENIIVIPISLPDKYLKRDCGLTSIPPKYIFTGNNWYANIHGLKWFINNVLDHVEIRLQVTGYKMESLKKDFTHPKIDFLGFVENLEAYIEDADYVLLPIFLGSGMKVKTCEALMYGKNIIGTRESFEGYEIDPSLVGAVCNTPKEFIKVIQETCKSKKEKFNIYSRNYFLTNYSFAATMDKFRELIN